MISKDVQKRIRQIEIHTKRLLRGSLVGQSSSAVKGSGFEFDQIREYQQGDDVRFIDWRSSARTGKMMTRQYIEERSRIVVLAVDISASSFFGSGKQTKYHVMSEIAGALALASGFAKDKVCLLLFAQEVELFVPPNSGQKHIHFILEKLFTIKPRAGTTSVRNALEYIARMNVKDVVLFFVSDFISPSFDRALAVVAKRYEMIAIRCLDNNELSLPRVGFLPVVDQESGAQATLNFRRKKGRANSFLHKRVYEQNRLFSRYGVDLFQVKSSQSYIQDMVRFFKKRMVY